MRLTGSKSMKKIPVVMWLMGTKSSDTVKAGGILLGFAILLIIIGLAVNDNGMSTAGGLIFILALICFFQKRG